MKKLVVDRSKWLRGEGGKVSYLLRVGDSKMCCLGFVCVDSGISPEEIEGNPTPRDFISEMWDLIPGLMDKLPKWLYDGEFPTDSVPNVVMDMMQINDSQEISGEVREQELTKLFASVDVEIQFIN